MTKPPRPVPAADVEGKTGTAYPEYAAQVRGREKRLPGDLFNRARRAPDGAPWKFTRRDGSAG